MTGVQTCALPISNILKISILELLGEEIQTPEVLENAPTNDVNKLRSEANYWREKFEQQVVVEAYRMVQSQYQREKIGF